MVLGCCNTVYRGVGWLSGHARDFPYRNERRRMYFVYVVVVSGDTILVYVHVGLYVVTKGFCWSSPGGVVSGYIKNTAVHKKYSTSRQ